MLTLPKRNTARPKQVVFIKCHRIHPIPTHGCQKESELRSSFGDFSTLREDVSVCVRVCVKLHGVGLARPGPAGSSDRFQICPLHPLLTDRVSRPSVLPALSLSRLFSLSPFADSFLCFLRLGSHSLGGLRPEGEGSVGRLRGEQRAPCQGWWERRGWWGGEEGGLVHWMVGAGGGR